MLDHDAADDPHASETHHPIDDIEPEPINENAYREAAQRGLVFLFAALQFVSDGKSNSEKGLRLWAVMCALEHPAVEGRTESEIATTCGYSRAALNKHVMAFSRASQLPPALSQKSTEARSKYRAARKAQLSPK